MLRIRANIVTRGVVGRTPTGARSRAMGLLLLATLPLLAAQAHGGALGAASGAPMVAAPGPHAAQSWGRMPLYFVPNRGQAAKAVDFYVPGRREQVYFNSKGLTFVLNQSAGASGGVRAGQPATSRRAAVRVGFLGARAAQPEGNADLGTRFNYLSGAENQWKTGVPAFGRLVYRNLWRGIDLVFHGTTDRMKYEFVVRPGADPRQIRLAYEGAERVWVNGVGSLVARTPLGDVTDAAPASYQPTGSEQAPVTSSWRVRSRGGCAEVSVRLGSYDHRRTLVIDPATFVYCGYIGGSGGDSGSGIAVDGNGSAYVVGTTSSSPAQGFPATPGSPLAYQGGSDAFVAKVAPDGTHLTYCSYVGGSGTDSGTGIAIDAAGSAYISGTTRSTPAQGFPVTVGPSLVFNSTATSEAFVAKLHPDGRGLDYCGYIGGGGGGVFLEVDTSAAGIAVDGSGSAYVVGTTNSSPSSGFPAKVGPVLTMSGKPSGFIAKVKTDGTDLVYCGFAGGANIFNSNAAGVAVDGTGSAYVVGSLSRGLGGSNKAFAAKVKTDGSAYLFQAEIGATSNFGQGTDGLGIALDPNGGIYVTGDTTAAPTDGFPAKVGPSLTLGGGKDAFVAKVHPDGNSLDYCGYIGGAKTDIGYAIDVDGSGNAYVTGQTFSGTADGFPASGGPSVTYAGGGDAFVARVKAGGSGLDYCGYIGGSAGGTLGSTNSNESGRGIAVDAAGDAYITGEADSTAAEGFPVTVGPSLVFGGSGAIAAGDAFVAKIIMTAGPPPPLISNILAVSALNGTGATITWTTDVASSSTVRYGKTTTYGSSTTGPGGVTSHTVTLIGLTPSTLYHFQVVSLATGGTAPGSQTASTDQSFTTRAGGTGSPPVISTVAATGITATGATITWTTDVNSSTTVEYGTTASYGFVATGAAAIQHSVTLSGLTPSTTYHYRVRSATATSPDAVSTDVTFTTSVATGTPVITSVSVTGIGPNSATVTWTTDIPASSSVDFGVTVGYGTTATGADGTTHSVAVTGLTASTLYHFHVRSTGSSSGIESVSVDRTFTTTATPGTPVISGISVTGIGPNSATITWTTDIPASTVVEYGKTASYGTTITGVDGTSHSVTLTGLLVSTTYHFRVRSTGSSSGIEAVSTDRTFTTTAVTPPAISGINVQIDGNGATITWTTDIPASSTVRYGTSAQYGLTAAGAADVTMHTATLSNLVPGTTYHFQVVSLATGGSIPGSQSTSPDLTFTILTAVTGLRALAVSNSEIDLSWSPVSGAANGYAIERRSGNSGFAQIVTTPAGTTTFADTGLQASTSYTYRVRALAGTGGSPYSAEATATTGASPTGTLKVVAQVNFGTVIVGRTGLKSLVLANASRTANLQVSVGSATGAYSVVSGGGTTFLTPGGSRTVTLQFRPTQRGVAKGTLTLTSSDPARGTVTVRFTGRGK